MYPLKRCSPPPPTDLLLRRETVERLGGFAENFTGIYHLYKIKPSTKVYLHEPVYAADECWDKYRRHPEQCISVVKKADNIIRPGFFLIGWRSICG